MIEKNVRQVQLCKEIKDVKGLTHESQWLRISETTDTGVLLYRLNLVVSPITMNHLNSK